MARYTKITGYWLFVNAHKHYHNDKGPYKQYFPKADNDYNSMHDFYSSFWDETARNIQSSMEAKMFYAADVLLKLLGEEFWELKHTLLQFRNRMCYELYLTTRHLLLQSLEICA